MPENKESAQKAVSNWEANARTTIHLDMPAQKVATVRSEIRRGSSAAFRCELEATKRSSRSNMKITILIKCIDKVKEENIQARTDSEPFLLGLHFKAWCLILESIASGKQLVKHTRKTLYRKDREIQLDLGKLNGISHFRYYREKSRQMGINDKAICETIGKSYERIKPKIDEWAQKY